MYQNATYVLVHEQIHFLSGDAFSLCALKFRHLIANPPWHKRNSLLKGMGDETLIDLLHVTPKKHPLLIGCTIGTTRLDHAPGCADHAPAVKLAKVDSDTP